MSTTALVGAYALPRLDVSSTLGGDRVRKQAPLVVEKELTAIEQSPAEILQALLPVRPSRDDLVRALSFFVGRTSGKSGKEKRIDSQFVIRLLFGKLGDDTVLVRDFLADKISI